MSNLINNKVHPELIFRFHSNHALCTLIGKKSSNLCCKRHRYTCVQVKKYTIGKCSDTLHHHIDIFILGISRLSIIKYPCYNTFNNNKNNINNNNKSPCCTLQNALCCRIDCDIFCVMLTNVMEFKQKHRN